MDMDRGKELLRDKFRGCLMGVAIGDALGMPVEMMSPDGIRAQLGPDGITGYTDVIQRKIKGTMKLLRGSTTDDTQLSLAVARSLIRCGGLDLKDQAKELADEWNLTDFGWGRATKLAALNFGTYFSSGGKEGRHWDVPTPEPAKPGESCGNGVAMKVAPLALWSAARTGFEPEPFMTDVMRLGLMTHGDPRASFAAAAVGTVIAALTRPTTSALPDDWRYPCLRTYVSMLAHSLERRFAHFRPLAPTLSEKLETAFAALGNADELRTKVGTGCFSLESVPFALGTFFRHPCNFRTGVLEAVNAGGDADSTASMVGAMIGANVGLSRIPKDLVDGLRNADHILKTADLLLDAALA